MQMQSAGGVPMAERRDSETAFILVNGKLETI